MSNGSDNPTELKQREYDCLTLKKYDGRTDRHTNLCIKLRCAQLNKHFNFAERKGPQRTPNNFSDYENGKQRKVFKHFEHRNNSGDSSFLPDAYGILFICDLLCGYVLLYVSIKQTTFVSMFPFCFTTKQNNKSQGLDYS